MNQENLSHAFDEAADKSEGFGLLSPESQVKVKKFSLELAEGIGALSNPAGASLVLAEITQLVVLAAKSGLISEDEIGKFLSLASSNLETGLRFAKEARAVREAQGVIGVGKAGQA